MRYYEGTEQYIAHQPSPIKDEYKINIRNRQKANRSHVDNMEFILTILLVILIVFSTLLGSYTRLWERSGLIIGACLMVYGVLAQPWSQIVPWRYFPQLVNLQETSESALRLVQNSAVQDVVMLLEKLRGLTAISAILVVGGLGSLLSEFRTLALMLGGIGASIILATAGILLQSTQTRTAGARFCCLAFLIGNAIAMLCYALSLPQVDALGGIGRPELAIVLTILGVGHGTGLIFIGIGMAVVSTSFAFYVLSGGSATHKPENKQLVEIPAKRYFTTANSVQGKPSVESRVHSTGHKMRIPLILSVLIVFALLLFPILGGPVDVCDQRYRGLNDLLQSAHSGNPLLVEGALRTWGILWVQGQIHASDLFFGTPWHDTALQVCESAPAMNGLWLLRRGSAAWTTLFLGIIILLGFGWVMSVTAHINRPNLVRGLAVYQILLTITFMIAAMTLDSFGLQDEFGPRLLSVLADLQLDWGFILCLVLTLALLPISLFLVGHFSEQ